jgi:Tfp pilus assembly ATPase PilU
MRTDLAKEFNQKLRKTKDPRQVHDAVHKYSNEMFSRLGSIAFCIIFPNSARKIAKVMHEEDKYGKMLNRMGHRISKMEKKTAKKIVQILELEGWMLIKKLEKLEKDYTNG